jgi:hypothetical protein
MARLMLEPANPFQEQDMRTLRQGLWVAGLWLATVAVAQAAVVFSAQLSGAQEVPPNASTATGIASLVLNDAQTALTYSITVSGLDFTGSQSASTADNLVAAHIHAPAVPGTNGPVVFGFFGAPFNDNNPNDVVVTPFAAGVGGTISGKWDAPEGNDTNLGAQIPNLLAGLAYLNFHTVQFPGGEIRGQILRVPEPGTLALIGVALGVACIGRRRRATGAAKA